MHVPPPDEELLHEQPDLYSRHMRAHVGIERLRETGALPAHLQLLDVGGGTGLTRRFFPADDVTVVDVFAGHETDHVVEPGSPLPFPDDAFDVVVSFDTLEHVVPADRATFLAECERVARSLVLVTTPHGTPKVQAAEQAVRTALEEATGEPHRWLSEHEQHGLPTLDDVTGRATPWQWAMLPSSPLVSWPSRIVASICYERLTDRRALDPLVRRWNEAFLDWDGGEPGYRMLLVAAPPGAALDPVRDAFAAGSAPAAARTLQQQAEELLALGALVEDLERARDAAQRAYDAEARARAEFERAFDAASARANDLDARIRVLRTSLLVRVLTRLGWRPGIVARDGVSE